MSRPVAILIGMPGSGKSAVGLALADQLGVGFRDTDHDVEELTGKPLREVLLEQGEARFRALEREAVARALDEHRGVLALGGGAVLHERTQAQLSECRVVHLWAGLDTLVRRVGSAHTRPLLAGDPYRELAALMTVRLPVYRRLARMSVRSEDRSAADSAQEIATVIGAPA